MASASLPTEGPREGAGVHLQPLTDSYPGHAASMGELVPCPPPTHFPNCQHCEAGAMAFKVPHTWAQTWSGLATCAGPVLSPAIPGDPVRAGGQGED